MRLSMWMIANQLTNFDLELDIEHHAPINLRSARRAYATDCVHVYQEKNDVICDGSGNRIRIKDIDVEYAFEIVQSIFDTYDDWNYAIQESASQNNFQTVIDLAWHTFHNPIVLLNEDFKVLAMTNSADLKEVDEEWEYLRENGYSSFHAIKHITEDRNWINKRNRKDVQYFHSSNNKIHTNCISVPIIHNNTRYGRINVLEKNRPLNEGDYQLLDHLGKTIAPYIFSHYATSSVSGGWNVFLELLSGQRIQKQAFANHMVYKQWKDDDTYVVMSMDFSNDTNLMQMCRQQLGGYVSSTEILIYGHHVVAIANKTRNNYAEERKRLEDMAVKSGKRLGISLPFSGLARLKYYYQQSCAAIDYGALYEPDSIASEFYHFGELWLMETPAGKDFRQLCACHPDAVRMARAHYRKQEEDQLSTIYVYLKNECSPQKTSQEMYVHKNTLLYRLKKIMGSLEHPLDNKYDRDYMYNSISLLELYSRKYKEILTNFYENKFEQD